MLKPADLVRNIHLTHIFFYYSQGNKYVHSWGFTCTQNLILKAVCLLFQGQCFVAINPDAFAPGFTDRSGLLMTTLRNLEPVSSIITLHNDFLERLYKNRAISGNRSIPIGSFLFSFSRIYKHSNKLLKQVLFLP